MTETAGNLAFRPEKKHKFALPALRTRFSSAKNVRCIVVLRQKRQFTSINLHLYHYAGNNPVKYTDPDGEKILPYLGRMIYNVLTSPMVSDCQPLGRAGVEKNNSLYNQQFHTLADQEQGMSTFLGLVANIPGLIGVVFTIANALAPPREEDGTVDFDSRKAFISGAGQEISRIDTILNGLSTEEKNATNGRGETYGDFLNDQKRKLTNEIEINMQYDSKEIQAMNSDRATRGYGAYKDTRSSSSETYASTVDYHKAFMDRKLDE